MEELPAETIDELLSSGKKSRVSKKLERNYQTWFYRITTSLGNCANPDCTDPRGKKLVFVWEHPSGQTMCRYCFLEGWLE